MKIGKNIVILLTLILNLTVVGLLVLGLLGSHISPQKLLMPAFATLILPFTIGLNVVFVLVWMICRKWYFLISLLMLALSYNTARTVLPLKIDFNGSTVPEYDFTLMTYNTHANSMMAEHTPEKPNPVIQYILDANPDILCLQEFSSSDEPEHLNKSDLEKIFRHYPYQHIHYKVETGWSSFGVATFSRFPIVHRSVVDFVSYNNLAIYTDIAIGNDTMRVYNCHLETNKLTESDKIMAERLRFELNAENLRGTTIHLSRKLGSAFRIRAAQADRVAESIALSPHPVIVAGDFNDVPGSYTYKKIKSDKKDAFVEKGSGFGYTFNQSIFKFRIDHIFYNPIFELVHFKRDNKAFYSDHFPLIASFNVNSL